MTKLYKKSELWFALVWIIVYVVGTGLAEGASGALGTEKCLVLPWLAALTVLAAVWLKKQGLLRRYGLCKTGVKASRFLFYLPLAVMVSCSLWFGVKTDLPPVETALAAACMLCVGFLEEVIFRGFLFKAMSRDSVKAAIAVSSLTFGIGHIVNLVNGSGAALVPTLCQVVYAAAAGFLFAVMFYRGGSLWACVAGHAAMNVISVFGKDMTDEQTVLVSLVLTAVTAAYTLVLMKLLPPPRQEAEEKAT